MSAAARKPAAPALPESMFVDSSIEARPVTLPDGSVHTLWFRQVSALEFRRFQLAERSADDDVRAGSMARLIAASLCNADGSPALTMERAAKLKPRAAGALMAAVLQVNGMGKPAAEEGGDEGGNAPLPGAATSGSGTSLPSRSGAEVSASGSA